MRDAVRDTVPDAMHEYLVVRGYRDFWQVVPKIARSLERSALVRLLGFTGSPTVGSHDATFYSLLREPSRERRLKILLLSPLAIGEMIHRQRTTGHTPQHYIRRILGTLKTLHKLRMAKRADFEVRLYERDPQWYFWIFDDAIFLDSHALGVGRRSPRIQLSLAGQSGVPSIFEELFESAWQEPGNIEVDFDDFERQSARLLGEARARVDVISAQRSEPSRQQRPDASASVWNVVCETYQHSSDLVATLRRELERTSEFLYYGSNGQTRFSARTADLVTPLAVGAQGACRYRFCLLSPHADEALREKVSVSTSGRTLEQTRAAIYETIGVLADARRQHQLDLEVRLRRDLGSGRMYVFDHTVCLSSFQSVDGSPSTWVLFRERGQDALRSYFRDRFLQSWEKIGGEPGGHVDLDNIAHPVKPAESTDSRDAAAVKEQSKIIFDVKALSLTIDGEPQRLPRPVLFFLSSLAYERGGFVPLDRDIDGRPARKRRTELGVRIGPDRARKIVETTAGLGYRLQPRVRVMNLGEPPQFPGGDMSRFPDGGW